MHDGKMVISSFDDIRNWRLILFIRLNKTATNVENGRSKRTTVPDPDPEIRRGRSSRPLDKWGVRSPKNVFSPQFGLKMIRHCTNVTLSMHSTEYSMYVGILFCLNTLVGLL